jgi:hypothetical protein
LRESHGWLPDIGDEHVAAVHPQLGCLHPLEAGALDDPPEDVDGGLRERDGAP